MSVNVTVAAPLRVCSPVFTSLTPVDVEAVLAIEQRVHAFPWTRGQFLDSLLAGYHAHALRLDGQLAGYAIVMITPDDAQLLDISIDLPWQRQGWGAHFMQYLLQEAQAQGLPRMLLEVRATNLAARALYARCGFTQIGLRRNYYPASSGREDALVLQCVLNTSSGSTR